MKLFLSYFKAYTSSLNKWVFLYTTLWVAFFVTLNFTIGIEQRIQTLPSFLPRFICFFLLYFLMFGLPYWIHFMLSGNYLPYRRSFFWIFLSGPVLFALKMSHRNFAPLFLDSAQQPLFRYLSLTINWPINALLLLFLIFLIWKAAGMEKPVAGLSPRKFQLKPYLLLLLCMVPLLLFASTRQDFLHMYPKVKNIGFMAQYHKELWPYKVLYELSYGFDFFSIEFFFRGFLVLGLVRYAGKDAILPMAAFYCSIHFGKPLLECITSYFGGILLGVIVYRTKSIWGGLIVHLGIAWLMEIVATYPLFL